MIDKESIENLKDFIIPYTIFQDISKKQTKFLMMFFKPFDNSVKYQVLSNFKEEIFLETGNFIEAVKKYNEIEI